jgi:hypothetical protein
VIHFEKLARGHQALLKAIEMKVNFLLATKKIIFQLARKLGTKLLE